VSVETDPVAPDPAGLRRLHRRRLQHLTAAERCLAVEEVPVLGPVVELVEGKVVGEVP